MPIQIVNSNISCFSYIDYFTACPPLFLISSSFSGDPAGGAVGSETLCFCSGRTWNRKKSGQSTEELKKIVFLRFC